MSGGDSPIILFDGVCNLCSDTVQFVYRRDRRQQFRFASLQSPAGKRLLKANGLNPDKMDSMILLQDGRAYQKSSAALRIAKQLNGPWRLLYLFLIVPPFIRNAVYDFIGQRRYRWFGKKDVCWVPEGDLSQRFLPEGDTDTA